jgi:hypothetical protein
MIIPNHELYIITNNNKTCLVFTDCHNYNTPTKKVIYRHNLDFLLLWGL